MIPERDTIPGVSTERRIIALRIRPAAIETIDTIAHEASEPGSRISRSDVIRVALSVALKRPAELQAALRGLRESR